MSNTASFHAERVNHSFANLHNMRTVQPDYLITETNIEFKVYNDISLNEMQQQIEEDYQKHNKQKYQKQFSSLMEAVINIKENTTLEDMDRLKSVLEARFGLEVVNVALHKDEGFFSIIDSTGNEYSINRKDNLKYKDLEDNSNISTKLFIDGIETEINGKLKRNFNFHAHLVYNKYDFENHKHIKLDRNDMKEIQTIVADCLNMERGVKGSKQKRLNHREYSQQKHQEMNTTKFFEINGEKLKMGDVKNFFKSNRELMINLGNMTQDDYKFIKKSESEILEKVKDKTITTPEELNLKLNENQELKEFITKLKDGGKKLIEDKNNLLKDVEKLKQEKVNLKEEVRLTKIQLIETKMENVKLTTENKKLKEKIQINELQSDNDMFNTFVPKQKENEPQSNYERER